MSNCSKQGNNYRFFQRANNRLIEGFSSYSTETENETEGKIGISPNTGQTLNRQKISNEDFSKTTDQLSNQVSKLARSQQQTQKETNDYLRVSARDSKYADKIVKTNDGVIGYITKRGIFKPFDSVEDAQATMGKNGCPANIEQIQTKGSTYTEDGAHLNTETPIFVGTPMVRGQQCGYAGQNIYINQPSKSSGEAKFAGCKRGDEMISTELKMDIGHPQCPVGTFACGNVKGYCYDPKRNQMVSTYMIEEYDAPIGEVINGKSSAYLADDGVTYLWPRLSNTFDKNACKFDKPSFPACPKGTAPCPSQPGLCWDPQRKIMATTESPNGGLDINSKPSWIALVKGDRYSYDETTNPFVFNNKPEIPMDTLQLWVADEQFSNPNKAPNNKVYLQFKAAAAQMMKFLNNNQSGVMKIYSQPNRISWSLQPNQRTAISGYFNINGSSSRPMSSITINDAFDNNGNRVKVQLEARGDTIHQVSPQPESRRNYYYEFNQIGNIKPTSNNGTFTITKINDNEAIGEIKTLEFSKQVKYQFETPIPLMDFGFLAPDGVTRMWKKQDGYDKSCGVKPDVPPVNKVKELIEKCKNIANSGGFNLFGIRNGECLVGSSVNGLETTDKCEKMNGVIVGKDDSIATYSLEGASNKGLYQYGYVSADEKLKVYPFDGAKQTRKFRPVGKQQILKTPRTKTFSNISKPGDCESKCFSEFGENCEAYGYNRQTKSCSIYGKDSLKKGTLLPGGKEDLMIRAYSFENDISCPKEFSNANSSVWANLPMDGFMNSGTKCNLGYVTESPQMKQTSERITLNDAVDHMDNIVQQRFEDSKQEKIDLLSNEEEIKLRKNINEYDRLYNQTQR